MLWLIVVATMLLSLGEGADALHNRSYHRGYRIGVVLDIGGIGDLSQNDATYAGLVQSARRFHGSIIGSQGARYFGNLFTIRYKQPIGGTVQRGQEMGLFGYGSYDLVIAIGPTYADPIRHLADAFPYTHFVLIDGFVPDVEADANLTCVTFDVNEISFLIGVLAGHIGGAAGARVGFIGAVDIPEIREAEIGYIAGATFANPDLRAPGAILSAIIGKDGSAFTDVRRAEHLARSMYAQDAQVIFHIGGLAGNGVIRAAYDANRFVIGSGVDQRSRYLSTVTEQQQLFANVIITSLIKRVDMAVEQIIDRFLSQSGYLDGGYITYGLEDGAFLDLAQLYTAPLDQSIDFGSIETLRSLLVDTSLTIPDTPEELERWLQNLL